MCVKSTTRLEQEEQKRPFSVGLISSHSSWQGFFIATVSGLNFISNRFMHDAHGNDIAQKNNATNYPF